MLHTRTTIRRHPERDQVERAAAILAEGHVAHVGFVDEGQAFVIPLGYQFNPAEPDCVYLHGSPASRVLKRLASGDLVCITVTLLDGLVYSRTALNHSMNYRSVVCFGRGRQVSDPQVQERVYRGMVSRYFPGRTEGRDYAGPTAEHLAATTLIEVRIEEWSAKAREGGPTGPLDGDAHSRGTCGVVPL
jgi:nitroimidazol reductase NimA-like FMN-containing flavoprotein (pyridoxamine 5'-phosphate oxidase superfamily)